MKLCKKAVAIGLSSLIGLSSMSVLANTPMAQLVAAEKTETMPMTELVAAEKVAVLPSTHWASESFAKAKEYGIAIPKEAKISRIEAMAHLMRTVSLVDTIKEAEHTDEAIIQEAIQAAKEMGIETDFNNPVQVLADLNYETLKLMGGNSQEALQGITRLELAKMIAKELKKLPIPVTLMSIKYSDVAEHDADLEFLANARIMMGEGDKFRPYDIVTREELVCVLVRVYEVLDRLA